MSIRALSSAVVVTSAVVLMQQAGAFGPLDKATDPAPMPAPIDGGELGVEPPDPQPMAVEDEDFLHPNDFDHGEPAPAPPPGPGSWNGGFQTIITAIATEGEAPFTVHVHGLGTNPPAGGHLGADFEWDFDDPAGAYNEIEAWQAAHTYDQPGTYQVVLRVYDNFESGVAVVDVTVHPSTRRQIHVSASGSDANDGATPATAIRSLSRLRALMTDHSEILFRRGDVFDFAGTLELPGEDVVVGAYGTGQRPVLRWSGAVQQFAPIMSTPSDALDIVIQDLAFTSTHPSGLDAQTPRGLMVFGTNVTVRGCTFNNLGQAMTSAPFGIAGWLTMNNSSGVLGTYYAWNRGRDICHIGNVCDDSLFEHNIRGQFITRIMIAHNELFNTAKTNFWFMEGHHAWASHNRLEATSVVMGPNRTEAGDSRHLEYARIQSNDLDSTTIRIYPGIDKVRIFDNLITGSPNVGIEVWGWNDDLNRGTRDVTIDNNTVVTDRNYAQGVYLVKETVDGLFILRNMFVAPEFVTGGYQSANVFIEERPQRLPYDWVFENNIWALPIDRRWCDGVFYAWHAPGICPGFLNEAEWDGMYQTSGEQFRAWSLDDLDAFFNPVFTTNAGARR
ncbi:MAG: PKD domain-containing protein [Planctomycetota bacterium]